MHCITRSFVMFIALLLAHQIAGIGAAGADEKRVERNFTLAGAPGPKAPAVPAAALRTAKGKLAVRIGSSDYELETLTVTPPGDGPFSPGRRLPRNAAEGREIGAEESSHPRGCWR